VVAGHLLKKVLKNWEVDMFRDLCESKDATMPGKRDRPVFMYKLVKEVPFNHND
jgi:hypothetical protein